MTVLPPGKKTAMAGNTARRAPCWRHSFCKGSSPSKAEQRSPGKEKNSISGKEQGLLSKVSPSGCARPGNVTSQFGHLIFRLREMVVGVLSFPGDSL